MMATSASGNMLCSSAFGFSFSRASPAGKTGVATGTCTCRYSPEVESYGATTGRTCPPISAMNCWPGGTPCGTGTTKTSMCTFSSEPGPQPTGTITLAMVSPSRAGNSSPADTPDGTVTA